MHNVKRPLYAKNAGFTIIELLVVIIVIAILATLTLVGYNGVRQRANETTIKADLHNALVALSNDNTLKGTYPSSVATANNGKGLDASPGTTYQYTYDSVTNSFCLTATNSNLSYYTSSSNTSLLKGACSGHVDAAAPGPAPVTWTQVVAGDSFSTGLRSDNTMYSWGVNPTGQFSNNATSTTAVSTPQADTLTGVTSGQTITSIGATTSSSSNATLLAVDSAGSMYGWGYNNTGQTGVGNTTSPLKLLTKLTAFAGKTMTQTAAGLLHSVGLDSTGKVYTWGDNTYGQLGNGTTTSSVTPVTVTGGALAGKTVTAVAAGFFHSLALDSTGKLYSWGDNTYGQLGIGSTTQQNSPVAVSTSGVLSGKTIVAIAVGGRLSMVLDSNGQLYAWGQNGSGEVGNGSAGVQSSPVAVSTSGVLSGKTIKAMSAAYGKAMALDSTGQVYAWGSNTYGQLGDGTTTNRNTPVAVTGLSGVTIKSISSSYTHSLAIDSAGAAWAWGLNTSGQLGDGTTTNRSTPVLVTGP